jgi:hypothetical protein
MKSHFSSLHTGFTIVTVAYSISSKQDLFNVDLTIEADFSYGFSPCPPRLGTPVRNNVVTSPGRRKKAAEKTVVQVRSCLEETVRAVPRMGVGGGQYEADGCTAPTKNKNIWSPASGGFHLFFKTDAVMGTQVSVGATTVLRLS